MDKLEMYQSLMAAVEPYLDRERANEAKVVIKESVLHLIESVGEIIKPKDNEEAMDLFIKSKNVEGCSAKTLKYYESTLKAFFAFTDKHYFLIGADDIRDYLSSYKEKNSVSQVSMDNVRRIVSSFFSWLENEDYILKSPTRRIKKIKMIKVVKEVYSDETIELIRQAAINIRDLAMIDFLLSTGVRVGELVNIRISDVNFASRECVVLGKGKKQRRVYFDAATKMHVRQYLDSRNDENEYLFVSSLEPHNKLEISGVEIVLRKIGKKLGIEKVHPHKFRRTLATKAIEKGMPIEQVQHLLGHTKIDTTLEYAMVDDNNVKMAHKKFLER